MGTPTYFYHPIHGGHLFDSDSPPNPKLGWFTRRNLEGIEIKKEWDIPLDKALVLPAKTAAQVQEESERSEEPELGDPTTFADVDAYMEDFTRRLSSDLVTEEREKQLKRAMSHYANINYAMAVDKRKSVEKIAIEIRDHAALKRGS